MKYLKMFKGYAFLVGLALECIASKLLFDALFIIYIDYFKLLNNGVFFFFDLF